jgi:hypothetical protein
MGWKLPFHPDDMEVTSRKWQHSLATGEPYSTEYRCRSKSGEWRWMLGRAVCLRNKWTGEIEKWYGTCTDVHEEVEARFFARRTKQHLLSVIAHAQVTLFAVDRKRKITLLEGSFIWDVDNIEAGSGDDSAGPSAASKGDKYIGANVYDVFGRANGVTNTHGQVPTSLHPIEDILNGKTMEDVQEHYIGKRCLLSRDVYG